MRKEKPEIIDLNKKTDLLAVNIQCPICGEKYLHGVPYVNVPCRKCGTTHRTDFKQDIYTKKARQIWSIISYKNSIIFRVDEDYEAPAMCIRQHFIEQACWDVSDIKAVTEEYKRCMECGMCPNCFICKKCGKTFEKDKNKRKQTCPHCKSNDFTKTHFKNTVIHEKNKNLRLCPFCKSDRIVLTRTKNKSKCHACGSRKLTEKVITRVFVFRIDRKRAYRRENV